MDRLADQIPDQREDARSSGLADASPPHTVLVRAPRAAALDPHWRAARPACHSGMFRPRRSKRTQPLSHRARRDRIHISQRPDISYSTGRSGNRFVVTNPSAMLQRRRALERETKQRGKQSRVTREVRI